MCEYCSVSNANRQRQLMTAEDRHDGYAILSGSTLEVTAKMRGRIGYTEIQCENQMSFDISYCPMCGRKL